jgi:predicted GNAT family acetyltransferase
LEMPVSIPMKEKIIQLSAENADEVYDLVSLVQPGYFQRKTFMLGNYYGIFKERRLVALTGERMKTDDFTELSAIVTHPEHTGNGYAKQLIAEAAGNVFASGKSPYLHVAESNDSAIRLYEKLGFTTRRKMSFWHISK